MERVVFGQAFATHPTGAETCVKAEKARRAPLSTPSVVHVETGERPDRERHAVENSAPLGRGSHDHKHGGELLVAKV
jgi:hypothetical protein